MEITKIFETVSFHLIKPCNMSCKFCYATYNTLKSFNQLKLKEIAIILLKLKKAGVKKVTFAGGEPMLHPDMASVIMAAKMEGLTTSIITNGSMLDESWLRMMEPHLDWVGISIDSVNTETNKKIGRVSNNRPPLDYYKLIDLVRKFDYKLKINTVVNIHNQEEDFKDFINHAKPERWKIFDTLRVEGQNETQFEEIKSTGFSKFTQNNYDKGFNMVVETNDLMTKSYLLIDPMGRFYENWGSETRKSDSLVTHSVEHCLEQVELDRDKFLKRGGVYEW